LQLRQGEGWDGLDGVGLKGGLQDRWPEKKADMSALRATMLLQHLLATMSFQATPMQR
jgi:hypothetical protein